MIDNKIEELLNMNIYGCITGQCLIAKDTSVPVELWDEETDVDIFTYTHPAWISAVQILLDNNYIFGEFNSNNVEIKQNEVKWNRQLHEIRPSGWLHTLKLHHKTKDNVTVNVSFKKDLHDALAILSNYDTTAVMKAIDMPTKNEIDLRLMFSESVTVARPNPIRWGTIIEDASTWKASMMIRQWNRVLKLWNRGIDSRPLAQGYKELLETLIETGCLFSGEDSKERFNIFTEMCQPILDENILPWLEKTNDSPQK